MGKSFLKIFLCGLFIALTVGCGNKNEEKQEEKLTINLNDNIYYIVDAEFNGRACGGYAFPVDPENVIAERWFSNYSGMKEVDKNELFSHSDINYDLEKEMVSLEEWNLLTGPSRGVKDFESGYIEHHFYFSFWYVKLVKDAAGNSFKENDKYYKLATDLEKDIFGFKTQARSIIVSRNGYHLKGTCEQPARDVLLLDENVCSEYNLECGRW